MQKQNYATLKTIKNTFDAGTDFTLSYTEGSTSVVCTSGDKRAVVKCENMHKYFKGFKKCPSMATLEKQMDNGVCTSITGANRVEPDGYDSNGFPSWPIALGMI